MSREGEVDYHESKQEYIICAAIHYDDGEKYEAQPVNIQSGYVWCGRRHHNIIQLRFKLLGLPTRERKGQGFVTSKNRFVDRKEGAQIAFAAGQITRESDMLISEDLY